MRNESYTHAAPRKPRGSGKRKCLICGMTHRPKSDQQKRCGSCEAKHQAWLALHGFRR